MRVCPSCSLAIHPPWGAAMMAAPPPFFVQIGCACSSFQHARQSWPFSKFCHKPSKGKETNGSEGHPGRCPYTTFLLVMHVHRLPSRFLANICPCPSKSKRCLGQS